LLIEGKPGGRFREKTGIKKYQKKFPRLGRDFMGIFQLEGTGFLRAGGKDPGY